jgi:hypothetical protein
MKKFTETMKRYFTDYRYWVKLILCGIVIFSIPQFWIVLIAIGLIWSL